MPAKKKGTKATEREKTATRKVLNTAFEEYKRRISGAMPAGASAVKGPLAPPTGAPPDFPSFPFMSAPAAPGGALPSSLPPPLPFPGPVSGFAQAQGSMADKVGRMLMLGVDVVNASLSGWLKVMEGFGAGARYANGCHFDPCQGQPPCYGGCCCMEAPCCCESCCECCCTPGVHNCC